MSATDLLWVNDRLVAATDARLDPRDRGWTLGDGVFETMRVHNGAVLRFERHLARLRSGAEMLALPLPWTDADLSDIVAQTLAAQHLSAAVVRLSVSRGVPAQRGLMPDPDATPMLVVHAQPFGGYPAALYARGMRAIVSRIRRNEHSPLANVKSLCYLDNVLARTEAATHDADEALMCNTAGELVCASAANIFLVMGGVIATPPLRSGALPGTMRGSVLDDLAPRLGVEAVERPLSLADLAHAGEAFVTSALLGVMPLTVVDDHPIGDGTPGPITRRLGDLG